VFTYQAVIQPGFELIDYRMVRFFVVHGEEEEGISRGLKPGSVVGLKCPD
jgi:hypothetical protein